MLFEMMETFRSILLESKIDFSKTIVERISAGSVYAETELKPKDFIRFAKQDFSIKDKKGLINAITNAKRAIDCQIDNTLFCIGINPDKILKTSESLVKDCISKNNELPYKLKLIQSLGFSPGNLTANVRTLRHKLEHYYQIPKFIEVEEAIEIAELFILAIESKSKIMENEFLISSENFNEIKSDKIKSNSHDILDTLSYETQIRIEFNFGTKEIEIIPFFENVFFDKFKISSKHSVFYYLIRLLNNLDDHLDAEQDLRLLLHHCNHPISTNNIKISQYS